MTSRHTLSHADELYVGSAWKGGYKNSLRGIQMSPCYWLDFGAPLTADPDGVSASQSVGAGASFLINGALASGGVATFDVPRNVVAAWTTASVLTITGTDEHGDVVVEQSASGTSHAGKKAFKTITSVTSSAAITLATVGTGDVLGLPFRVDENGLVAARAAGAIDAGTFVEADTTSPATATTGDVRGTFDPAVALNGTNKVAVLIVPATLGEGAFGVDQYAG